MIYLLTGPPASGKSTKAKDLQKKDSNRMVVSRDAIRESLVPDHRKTWYQRPDRKVLETIVTSIVQGTAKQIMSRGYDVIIDETNPDFAYWSLQGDYQVIEMTTPIEECIYRDSLREYPVGAGVIEKIATKLEYAYRYTNWVGKEVVKKSGRPFTDGQRTQFPISVIDHPITKRPAFLFGNFWVECRQCKLV